MLKSVDEITASARAAKAKGHAEYADHCFDRAVAHQNTLMEARRARPYTSTATFRDSADASRRIAHAAYGAARSVVFAIHSAAIACREAKTPLARKLAEEANESATYAARVALAVAKKACATCAEAVEDAEDAERDYTGRN
jgi:hypothetical protein